MRILIPFLVAILLTTQAFGSTYHQKDSTHTLIYTITDLSGNHVSGQTVRLTVKSHDAVNYYDFDDGSWGLFGSITTKHATLHEDADGGLYFYQLTVDSARRISGDAVFIISNDDATYGDLQAESVNFDTIGEQIRTHR